MFLSAFDNPLVFLAFMVAIIVALTVHEYAHALVAYFWGDDTAYRLGRLTLNPIAHLDPLGSVLFLLIGFGWGRPVPTDPSRFRNQKIGDLTVALAGPFSNLILAIFGAILFNLLDGFLSYNNLLFIFLILFVYINLALMFFNLIPIPPLDGSHVLRVVLPERFSGVYIFLSTWGTHILFFLILMSNFGGFSAFSWISRSVIFISGYFGVPLVI